MEPIKQPNSQSRPIPFAVLKVQLKKLVDQQGGVLFTRDLLTLIDQYETYEQVTLLTQDQKRAILPYTLSNPDLEMTPDDILNLLKLVFPPSPVASISAPSRRLSHRPSQELLLLGVRPRTSSPLKLISSASATTSSAITKTWKRRPSVVASFIQAGNSLYPDENEPILTNEQPEITSQNKKPVPTETSVSGESGTTPQTTEEQYSNQDLECYYRRSLKLTQRLKSSEQSLASLARDNEDRILHLQDKVDDMTLDMIKQRKEIQEYKNKETSSLEQISALETHISKIQRSETDQKQVYLSIKHLFDEKCVETQKLQELLRQKEGDLQNTEDLLHNFQTEVASLGEERSRLVVMQRNLELELETSAQAHRQLAEQKSENEKLKGIIDNLKVDLVEALHIGDTSQMELNDPIKELENELANDENKLKSVQDEKDYYKNRASEAKEDLDRVKNELDYLRRALDSENRSLMNELAALRKTQPSGIDTDNILIPTVVVNSTSVEMNIPSSDVHDLWSQSRLRQRHKASKKRRTVQDFHETSSGILAVAAPQEPRRTMTRKDDKLVTSTVTFALYTLLVYFFGIVTSSFLMDGGAQGFEQALVAATASGQIPKSKIFEIILYWLEKLLFEPQGLPVS
ncbi:hypothetical protein K501DRAFT_287406 [Backusella circina FSU 941]|nr:hypothetical protein K501DRAFT_287406 [Backusella circina FSU 941]